MSNHQVWIRWKRSTVSDEWEYDVVTGLRDSAQIWELRNAFVDRHLLHISPAAVEVRETEHGEKLRASTKLTNYFIVDAGAAVADGPGKSEETALFLTFPEAREPSPSDSRRKRKTAPPSQGEAPPKLTHPRKAPSSDEGRLEGLLHASDDANEYMQCTSNPVSVRLLRILEEAVSDEANGNLDDRFFTAARHVADAQSLLRSRTVPEDMGTNERFFTGAMANALNSVLRDGYCVLHHACLGVGATHSDLSAYRICKNGWPATLMVGEGEWYASNLRAETRGQIFNELLRHRTIDSHARGTMRQSYGPILLLAFDQTKIEVDLAFPSTKGGKLAKDKAVDFRGSIKDDKETFWTVRMLRMDINGEPIITNLSIALKFIADALEILHSSSLEARRVQHKLPLGASGTAEDVSPYRGPNVTILVESTGSKYVYKEFCYHLRQASPPLWPLITINDSDQRKPPPKSLLRALGSPYDEQWKLHEGPFGTCVLQYPFIDGSSCDPSVAGWLEVLQLVQKMHDQDFIHGDLLPRNVLFAGTKGYIVDFDLSREEGGKYVVGYNYQDFQTFRHDKAREGRKMKKEHDVHSLRQLSRFFFDIKEFNVTSFDLVHLIELFRVHPDLTPAKIAETDDEATGSPERGSFAL